MSANPSLIQKDDDNLAELLAHVRSTRLPLPDAISDPARVPAVAAGQDPNLIEAELKTLPIKQTLHEYKQYRVYVGSFDQLPVSVREITRQRERTFRSFQEGSGQAVDTDAFDKTYLHLFAWDWQTHAMVGGYRLGRVDELHRACATKGTYLGEMFDFDQAFYAGSAMLEIGRSFVVPEYQKSHSSLYLLWSGIGRFLVQHPHYRRVYGVVSISRLYNPRSMAVIRDALLEPVAGVQAKSPYDPDLGQPWHDYLASHQPLIMREVSRIVRALEADERDVPVLIRHYHKLGARFVAAAVDKQFNNTPGLLLLLDVPAIPAKYMKQYFGLGAESYLGHEST